MTQINTLPRVIMTLRAVIFDQPDKHGNIITRESLNLSEFELMVQRRDIISYTVDDIGVLVIVEGNAMINGLS